MAGDDSSYAFPSHVPTCRASSIRVPRKTDSAHTCCLGVLSLPFLRAGIPIEDSDVSDLGGCLTMMMTEEQLQLAHLYYNLNYAPRKSYANR